MHGLRFPVSVVVVVVAGLAMPARAAGPPVELTAHESAPRPAPAWVRMVDLGEQDPALRGYRAPAGVKVEVVAAEPDVINPVGVRFTDDGRLLVIEWKPGGRVDGLDTTFTYKDGSARPVHQWAKDVPDTLKVLSDTDGDGTFDHAEVVMDDLQLPSSVLPHDGWLYFTTRGGVLRRRQSNPGPGNPFDVNERIVNALSGFNQHQASGLTISPDGWLFVTSGDDDAHPEGADGSRGHLLRNGGVWMMRPDGSDLRLFARGFRNPYRDVALDAFGNMFHMDNDQEDGSKFQGCRLVHVMEEADYGWRLKPSVRCCWPDVETGAIWGELPGKMPSMLKTGRGAPCGLLVYQGTGFPDFFHGLLIYPDVFQRNVRAYRVARDGSTFKVTEQFTLLESDEGLFRPNQAVQGPDGAIYLCDWRTDSAGPAAAWGDGQHGRIWRLSWGGTTETPAVPRGGMDAWANVSEMDERAAARLLRSPDGELRRRAADRLAGLRSHLLFAEAMDTSSPVYARAAGLQGAARLDAWLDHYTIGIKLLKDKEPEIRRLAADTISRNLHRIGMAECRADLADAMQDPDPSVRRASALALAASMCALEGERARSWPGQEGYARKIYDALRADDGGDRYLRDGFLRALERLGSLGVDLLFAPAMSTDAADREFAVSQLEALRTREGARVIERVLREARGLTPEQTTRLLTAYRYIQTEPAVDPAPIAAWLESNPEAPAAAQVAALVSIAKLGEADASRVLPIVLRLLQNPRPEARMAVYSVVRGQRLLAATKPLVAALKDNARGADERREILAALAELRGEQRFAQIGYDPGVLGVLDDLAAVAADDQAPIAVRGDALGLLAQLDFAKARPLAIALIESGEAEHVSAGITALGGNADATRDVARRFIEGGIARQHLAQVAAALQRHAAAEGEVGAEFAELRAAVLKSGLSLAGDPDGAKRVEQLVRTTGNAERGRAIFLDAAKSTCITCHALEGRGGQIGPDLTGLTKNATVAKLVESIVEPSKEIKEGFEQYVVQTTDGQTYAGYKTAAEAGRVVLRDAQGNDVVIPAERVKRQVKSNLSLMPEGSYGLLTLGELADLVAFLADADAQAALRDAVP